ncbi:SDR family NAD(P)-dependent oxidoreductase [Paramicrobacterium agarici]|uniref:SDR family NAD(P)-dependent oxidoreductase n=1 Tax=Paramicrobacterium agarici TaxID=630514 RepID=UPI00114D4EB9|nr:SDR family NAD(P)-dependent oxidoreductase [Microbacterium agarici]TQO21640.1 short-subunit dehydrogenase [Microbacterium agarici]
MTETTTALVTGANKGIGREVAAQLASLGTNVLLASRDPHRGAVAAAELGPRVHPVTLDVTDRASVLSAARSIEKRFGGLDILVNNAGIGGDLAAQSPSSIELPVVREVFETNVFGVISVTTAMLPLLARSPAARIVNVSSGLGSIARMTDPEDYFTTRPPMAAYVPSKTALNSLTVQYAKELRSHNILVNAADPGPSATDFTAAFPGLTRTAADGAAVVVRLATLSDDGPTGGFFDEHGPVPW